MVSLCWFGLQRSRSECGSAAAAWRSSPAVGWATSSGSSTHTPSPGAAGRCSPGNTRTRTHTHMRTNTRMCAHVHRHVRVHTRAHRQKHPQTDRQTDTLKQKIRFVLKIFCTQVPWQHSEILLNMVMCEVGCCLNVTYFKPLLLSTAFSSVYSG